MKKVIVASQNPTKIHATEIAWVQMFPNENFILSGATVESGVSIQPMTDLETYRGALNRAQNARQQQPDADFWIGIEGGIDTLDNQMLAFAWVVVLDSTQIASARTATFALPPKIAQLITEGYELGVADDMFFARRDSKLKNGAVGILTDDAIDRANYYAHAVILALIPFKNVDLYEENT
ncbi:MAG: inosine/xanthosine triphosphatase [Microscillaceae bacterium]|jgi:inosine/xanthosine triphosphatase|nr:inosine/xanthosine triphosphatase [Microscillaceae bacterium]